MPEDKKKTKIETSVGYVYNRETDTYITSLKAMPKPLVLNGSTHRCILEHLSGYISSPMTVEQVATKFNIPVKILEEYKKIYGITRDSLPLTDEEIISGSDEDNANLLMLKKRLRIMQAFEKEEWKSIQADALAWQEFQSKQFDPVARAIERWTPPEKQIKISSDFKTGGNQVLVIGLSDIHYGASSKEMYMFNRPEWTTKKTVEAVEAYAQKIAEDVGADRRGYKKIIILGLGDIIHSVSGKTARGTELTFDTVREEQFDYALNSLYSFIGAMYSLVPNIEVHSVGGNHNYEADTALFRALDRAFSTVKNIKFHHYSTRPASFKEGNTLFMLDHGADSIERAYVPTASDSKLQLHVQSLLLQKPENLIGIKDRLFCVGDKHHWEHIEFNDFQFIMFSTLIAGDMHASVNNLKNRARQSYLVLDDSGLRRVGHVYFD